MKRAIIIGATSGIGRSVAEQLLREGWQVGIAGRRRHLLEQIAQEHEAERVHYAAMDVTQPEATLVLDELLQSMGGVELLLFATGIGRQNRELDEKLEIDTVKTNCEGMVRVVDHFVNYVKQQPNHNPHNKAHIAVITSVAGTAGIGSAPAYSATKRMQATYLSALAQLARMEHLPIIITDIRPGFVATPLLNPEKSYPMLISCDKAADYIVKGLARRKRIITFDWRYRLLVGFWRLIPRWLWERMTFIKN